MEMLKQFRLQNKLSLRQMAELMNVSLSMYEKVEYGKREPSREFLLDVKRAFPQFDMNELFEELLNR